MKPVFVLNGPNLGRLGQREPDVYGHTTYAELVALCGAEAQALGLVADVRQSDDEATLVGWLHEATGGAAAVVINPAALSHFSTSVRDACGALDLPVVEVHITNIAAREEFRHVSLVSAVVRGTITGLGVDSYRLALIAIARLLEE
ncbi:MAG TPA: type II 3-dehydroquinate dehydratase [Mycobacteriales bacterium]|nr:type II 3-dehydroquinate dehydratase [Mycobacteriales bacterium]